MITTKYAIKTLKEKLHSLEVEKRIWKDEKSVIKKINNEIKSILLAIFILSDKK